MHSLPIIVQKWRLSPILLFNISKPLGKMNVVNDFTPKQKQFVHEQLLQQMCKIEQKNFHPSPELFSSQFNLTLLKVKSWNIYNCSLHDFFFCLRLIRMPHFQCNCLIWQFALITWFAKKYFCKNNPMINQSLTLKLWWLSMTFEKVLEEIDNLPFNGYKPLQVPPLLNLQSAFREASAKTPLGWLE